MCTVVKKAYCAGKRIRVERVEYKEEGGKQYVGHCWNITGRGWDWHTLHRADTTLQQAFDSAVAMIRKKHPRAAIYA